MNISINQIYKTPAGLFLKVKKVGALIHTFWLVDEKGEIVPERRNSFGHVVIRNIRICSEETVKSFKKVKSK